ncbi:MAG: gliding motility protein GldN [Bacteroidaceae bacterium]|nr:gliding motility protein GldN [Bacteroidaceae bacterium]
MKRILSFILITTCVAAAAQPPARQREAARQQAEKAQAAPVAASERAALEFPSAADMPEDVSWRRDIYRSLDLTKDKNAVLYYPEEPQADRMNLFAYLFKLMMRRQIKVYNYTIDGNEDFSDGNAIAPKAFLERNHIPFQEKGGRFRIEDSDIPSGEVNTYYIKESTYFDQHTASFHTRVSAICPVRREVDEFGAGAVNTPLFWVKYSDAAPYLAKLSLNGSNYNNAALISADDYFTTNQYDGKIYKTNNLQGRVLANYCPTDSDMVREQARIEGELTTFEKHVWNDSTEFRRMQGEQALKDSLAGAARTREARPAARAAAQAAPRQKAEKGSTSNSSRSQTKRQKSSASPSYSVRRQRH